MVGKRIVENGRDAADAGTLAAAPIMNSGHAANLNADRRRFPPYPFTGVEFVRSGANVNPAWTRLVAAEVTLVVNAVYFGHLTAVNGRGPARGGSSEMICFEFDRVGGES